MNDLDQLTDEKYFQLAVLHTLHAQYEVLLAIAQAAGMSGEALKEMVEAHQQFKYEVPFRW